MSEQRFLQGLEQAGAAFERVVAGSSGAERAAGLTGVLARLWPEARLVACRLESPEGGISAARDAGGRPNNFAFDEPDPEDGQRCELGDPSLGTLLVAWGQAPVESDRALLRLCARHLASLLRCANLLDTRRRSEDLIELGEMAGPVMHEFNNLLNLLSLRLALIEQELAGVSPGALDHIRRQATAVAALVARFQGHRKSRAGERRPIDLARVLGQFELERGGLRFAGGEGSPVLWDVVDIQNLLTFLVRFSEAHQTRRTPVTASLGEVDGWVTIRCEMAGPPQSAGDYFAPRPDAPAPATGLELAACRSLVSRAGGRMSAAKHDVGRVVLHIEMPPAPRSA